MEKGTLQVIIPGWMTRIDDKVLICTNGIAWPKGVWIMPIDKSYKRFIKNSWYD